MSGNDIRVDADIDHSIDSRSSNSSDTSQHSSFTLCEDKKLSKDSSTEDLSPEDISIVTGSNINDLRTGSTTNDVSVKEYSRLNTLNMVYQDGPNAISPFQILSDFPNGDINPCDSESWKGVLNVHVTIPANSNIDYPLNYEKDEDVSVMVDLMKCTRNNFKGLNFYFPIDINPNESGSKNILTSQLCNAACMLGYSAVDLGNHCNGKQNLKHNFQIACHDIYDLIIMPYFRCTQLDFPNNNVSVKLQIAISFTSYILKQFQKLAVMLFKLLAVFFL